MNFPRVLFFFYFELTVLPIRSSINKNTQGGTLEVVGTVNVLDVVCANAGNWQTHITPHQYKGTTQSHTLGLFIC